MKLPKFLTILFLALFYQIGCTPSFQKFSSQAVIQVNDQALSAKEFSIILARKMKDLDALTVKDPSFVKVTKERVVDDFVARALTLDYARAYDLSVDEKALDAEVIRLRASYPDDLSFRRELATEGLSFSEWREEIRVRLIETLVFAKINEKSKPPSNEELRAYYEEKKDSFKRKPRILVRQIVLDDEGRAEFIKTELKKKSFDELAKRYSITPERKTGGLLGWIEQGSVEYFDTLFSKPINQILGPIKSPYGYHLVRVEKKIGEGVLPFEEVASSLRGEFLAKKGQANFISWLDSQVRASRVLKNSALIEAIQIETRSGN